MPTAIALIRGINVGGKNILPMAVLRDLCEGIGLRDVRTYIQSGNVAFRADARQVAKAAAAIEAAIERSRKFRPSVIVRTLDEVREAFASNPFAARKGLDRSRCLIMFLGAAPSPAAKRAVLKLQAGRDEVRIIGREAFLNLPDGIADATLSMSAVEAALGERGTCRNLNTLEKLLNIADEIDSAESA